MPKRSSTQTTASVKKVVAKVKKVADLKKAPAKKVVKKIARPEPSKDELVYADNETSFWVADGKILNTLVALHEALMVMDKETFTHHAAQGKNDFAEWVETVLGDSECATALWKSKTTKAAATAVAKSLKSYRY
jgi:hypothetical protein